MSVVDATPVSAAKTAAAAATVTTDWAALKSVFAGAVRLSASAASDPTTYAAIAGAGPNSSAMASANAADSVSSSLNGALLGKRIGISSPALTNSASTAKVSVWPCIDQPAIPTGTRAASASSASAAL